MNNYTIEQINFEFRRLFDEIENELNKNTISKGDLQPGNLYFKPTIVKVDTSTSGSYKAGGIKDFLVTDKFLDNNVIKLKRAIGYTAVSRFMNEHDSFKKKQKFLYLMEEIKLAIKSLVKVSPDELNWGDYYIQFSEVRDEEDIAAYGFDILSNCLPVIELNETNESKYR